MIPKAKLETTSLLESALKELESTKGSVCAAIQRLSRAADMVGDHDTVGWCGIQLGDSKFTEPVTRLVNLAVEAEGKPDVKKYLTEKMPPILEEIAALGINAASSVGGEELRIKGSVSTGGLNNIGFIEERYADLIRQKKGNDGTYFKNDLNEHISYVRRIAHQRASRLYKQLAYSGLPQSSFEILKTVIDDKLLDLDARLGEQLMTVFKAVDSQNQEEWSQALTSCRRMLKSLADILFPPKQTQVAGRDVGEENYINRLWAFMDRAIISVSNKSLAKAHVDFLGSYSKH